MRPTTKQKNVRIGFAAITVFVMGWILSYSFAPDKEEVVKVEKVIDGETHSLRTLTELLKLSG